MEINIQIPEEVLEDFYNKIDNGQPEEAFKAVMICQEVYELIQKVARSYADESYVGIDDYTQSAQWKYEIGAKIVGAIIGNLVAQIDFIREFESSETTFDEHGFASIAQYWAEFYSVDPMELLVCVQFARLEAFNTLKAIYTVLGKLSETPVNSDWVEKYASSENGLRKSKNAKYN